MVAEKEESPIGMVCHFIAGLLTAFIVLVHPALSIIGFLGFSLYEVMQWIIKGDPPLTELKTFLFGFFLGAFLLKFLIVGTPFF